MVGLQEPERAIAIYEARLAAAPAEVREHRFLANAYLGAHAYERALEVVDAGLRVYQPTEPAEPAALGV